ncbi:MAG TPA: carbonate dehydratase [Phycisphaerales bacterium]|nr:carbonate dehydratase [Phycisphaerales bacterium]
MIRPNTNGDLPKVDPTAYIDPSAQVIGNVHIGAEVFVGPNAVVRADESDAKGQVHSIEIGAECNIQDGVIIHALGGTSVTIGERTSLAHGCVVHGPCTIGKECFIGFRAVVYKAALADGVFVNASAVVQGVDLVANAFVPSGAIVSSSNDVSQLVSTTSKADREFSEKIVTANLALTKGYRQLKLPESV